MRGAPHPDVAPPAPASPGPEALTAVNVDRLGKTFHIPQQRYTTVRQRLVDRFRPEPPETLRALDDVSFEIRRGEFFGVAGRNGSGKSTLLRCVAGIYDYEEGQVEVAGRLAPFVELGVDLKPDLSARDNVILNATMLGLTRSQARERLDRIINFADLDGYTEMKLRNFSSGMKVRLAFAVAIEVDADVLLVDEVLAVGDASFQRRCFETFERLKGEGRTVVLVTHDMDALVRHCDRVLLLEAGRVVDVGEPERIAARYQDLSRLSSPPHEDRPDLPSSHATPGAEHTGAPSSHGETSLNPAMVTHRPNAVGDDLRRLASVTTTLAVTELKLHYLDSALGYLWAVMRPMLLFLVLYSVFNNVAALGRGVEHYGIYLLSAVVLWTYFTETTGGSVTSLARNEGLLRKMRFPRLAIPLSISAKSMINLGANSLVVLVFVFASGIEPRWSWLELPALAALLAVLATGTGMLLSAAYIRYRDTSQVWALAQQLLFFGSPIIYTAGRYPEEVQHVLSASPIAVIFTQMRHALIDPSAPTAAESVGGAIWLLIPFAVIVASLAGGLWFFSREAPRVAERV